jgi:HSP20 family protein
MTALSIVLNDLLHLHTAPNNNSRSVHKIIQQLSDCSNVIYPSPHQSGLNYPRFNIYETPNSYMLAGEFPGVSEKNELIVEWLANNILIVRGTVLDCEMERTIDETEAAIGVNAVRVNMYSPLRKHHKSKPQMLMYETDNSTAELRNSNGYQQISKSQPSTNFSTPIQSSDSSSNLSQRSQSGVNEQLQNVHYDKKLPGALEEEPKWIYPRKILHERQTGEFQRIFTFPTEVEPNLIKATLKDGLLRIAVPKKEVVIANGVRRIFIG